jgi:anti-sigma regulatory factor (Ser/Thr protein kinase)
VEGRNPSGRTTATDVSTALPFDDSAPRLARQFVAQVTSPLPGEMRADTSLLASELVTNAVRYGRPDIRLRLQVDLTRLRVDVHDGGGPMPPWAGPGPPSGQPHGRGLVIVNHLAASWGVDEADGDHGKDVWFELRVPDAG